MHAREVLLNDLHALAPTELQGRLERIDPPTQEVGSYIYAQADLAVALAHLLSRGWMLVSPQRPITKGPRAESLTEELRLRASYGSQWVRLMKITNNGRAYASYFTDMVAPEHTAGVRLQDIV